MDFGLLGDAEMICNRASGRLCGREVVWGATSSPSSLRGMLETPLTLHVCLFGHCCSLATGPSGPPVGYG